jgi:hypothetical protein
MKNLFWNSFCISVHAPSYHLNGWEDLSIFDAKYFIRHRSVFVQYRYSSSKILSLERFSLTHNYFLRNDCNSFDSKSVIFGHKLSKESTLIIS